MKYKIYYENIQDLWKRQLQELQLFIVTIDTMHTCYTEIFNLLFY